MTDKSISMNWDHGLGDTANVVRLLQLYRRRGYQIEISCSDDKAWLFEAAGCRIIPREQARTHNGWPYPDYATERMHGRDWAGNKNGCNICRDPLPDIGPRDDLWRELLEVEIDLLPAIRQADRDKIRWFLDSLPRPVVLLHAVGNTGQGGKSLPAELQQSIYIDFVAKSPGTLILVDWDHRIPRHDHYRIRHLDELGGCNVAQLVAMIDGADLMIGIDSGPFHVAGLTRTPALGLFQPGFYPSNYLLPRPETLTVVRDDDNNANWTANKRRAFRMSTHPAGGFESHRVLDFAMRMLSPPRYLDSPRQIAADVQLQQYVLSYCRPNIKTAYPSGIVDRSATFDLLLREATRRFERPRIVETGCARMAEDWAGAGYSTYIFGQYAAERGGRLDSVDLSGEHCAFARGLAVEIGGDLQVHEARGSDWLQAGTDPIDVLYLDSADPDLPDYQDVCRDELKAAWPRLHSESLILIDDTPRTAVGFAGKGPKAIAAALDRGWTIAHAGYQVLLSGPGRPTVAALPPRIDARCFVIPTAAEGRPVVYTALFGDRDQLREPTHVNPGVDYVAFTDGDWESDVWDVRQVPRRFADPRVENRFYKMHPGRLFPAAPWSIYLDASLALAGDPAAIAAEFPAAQMVAFAHPERDCAFAEAEACRRLAMADYELLEAQVRYYRNAGLPPAAGLFAGGCLLRRHTAATLQVCADWWREIMEFTARDQIALPFVLWRNGFACETFPYDLADCSWLKWGGHIN